MKFVNIFVKFLYLTSVCGLTSIYNPENDNIEAAFAAISSFCEEFFVKKSINFDVILFGNPSDGTNSIMAKMVQKYPVEYLRIAALSNWNYIVTKSSVVLLKGLNDLDEFNQNIKTIRDKNEELTFLIYLDQMTEMDVGTSCTSALNVFNVNFYYLYNMEITLRLEVPDLFSSLACNFLTLKFVSIFKKIELIWETTIKSERKFQNMHECPLIFAQFYSKFLYVNNVKKPFLHKSILSYDKIDSLKSQPLTSKLSGFIVDMAEILSKTMNFKPSYKFFEIDLESLYKDHFETILEIPVSISGSYRLSSHLTDNSVTLVIKNVIKNVKYVNHDFFLHSFDLMTWIVVFMSFGVAFVVIFYMNWRLGTVRICPRKELTRPALNVLQIVFGCRQKKLPRANFARFILILFILLCFVLRICYWSQLVGFMSSEVEKVEPRTAEDLIRDNYMIYSCSSRFDRREIRL